MGPPTGAGGMSQSARAPRTLEPVLELVVWGQPAGAGSKTAQTLGKRGHEKRDGSGRLVLIYRPSSPLTAPWMEDVEEVAAREWGERPPLDGALFLDVAFYEQRPRSHFFQRKGGDVLRPDAPAYPHTTATHDFDKMRRAISDSLTNAKVIADDKRIVAGQGWKFYADEPPHAACAVIRLGKMLYQTVEQSGVQTPVQQPRLEGAET